MSELRHGTFKHLSLIINPLLMESTAKANDKFALIKKYSQELTKSDLKQLIMTCYKKDVFTPDEVTLLFTMYELRAA